MQSMMYKCPATPIRTTRALFLVAYLYQFEPTSVVIGYLWMFIDILKLWSSKVMASLYVQFRELVVEVQHET